MGSGLANIPRCCCHIPGVAAGKEGDILQKNLERIAIYSRKSRFTGKGESVGNQVELCRTYIRANFGEQYADTAAVFEDEGFSGGNLNRPGFQQMMKAARDRQIKAVVVYRLDRISRNIGDFAALIEELGKLRVDFISIRENFDTSSPMGRAMMYIASIFSQLERETIAERIRDNMRELAKTGRWLGGVTPTGYCSQAEETISLGGKKVRTCHLKLIPQEETLVREIFHLYGETDSLTATEAALLARHVKTKNGRDFTRFSLKGILQNPVYLIADQDAYGYFLSKQADLSARPEEFDGIHGVMAYHRTQQQKGKTTLHLPVDQWIVSVGKHPGLIPGKTWIQVQESLERNKSSAYRKPRRNTALLTGLLWCNCGERMYPKLSSRSLEDGTPAYTYVCKRKERSKSSLCSGRNAPGNLLDTLVLEQVEKLPWTAQSVISQLEKRKHFYQKSWEETDRELVILRRQQSELQHKIDALIDSLADGISTTARTQILKRVEELQVQKEALQIQLKERETLHGKAGMSNEAIDAICKEWVSFSECVQQMTVEQKRNLLCLLVEKVIWDGQNAQIIWREVDPDQRRKGSA